MANKHIDTDIVFKSFEDNMNILGDFEAEINRPRGKRALPEGPGIYKVTCVDTQGIGVFFSNNVKAAAGRCLCKLRKNRHLDKKMQSDYNEYGRDEVGSFEFDLIEECYSVSRRKLRAVRKEYKANDRRWSYGIYTYKKRKAISKKSIKNMSLGQRNRYRKAAKVGIARSMYDLK